MDDKNKKQKDWANKLFGRQQRSLKMNKNKGDQKALIKKQSSEGRNSDPAKNLQFPTTPNENKTDTPQESDQNQPQPEEESQQKQLRQKSGITQGINSLRNRKKLAEITTQKDDYTNKKKTVGKEISKQKKSINPLERKRKNFERQILVLKAVKIALYLISALLALTAIFFFLIPIAQTFFGAGRAISGMQTVIKKRLEQVKNEMSPVKEKIEENEKKIIDYSKAIKELSEKQYQLQNQSLFARNSQNT